MKKILFSVLCIGMMFSCSKESEDELVNSSVSPRMGYRFLNANMLVSNSLSSVGGFSWEINSVNFVGDDVTSSVSSSDPAASFTDSAQVQAGSTYETAVVSNKFLQLVSDGIDRIDINLNLFEVTVDINYKLKIKAEVRGNRSDGIIATHEQVTEPIRNGYTFSIPMTGVAGQDDYAITLTVEAVEVSPLKIINSNLYFQHSGTGAWYDFCLTRMEFVGNNGNQEIPIIDGCADFIIFSSDDRIFEDNFTREIALNHEMLFNDELQTIEFDLSCLQDIDRGEVGFNIRVEVIGDNGKVAEFTHLFESAYCDEAITFAIDMSDAPVQSNYTINFYISNVFPEGYVKFIDFCIGLSGDQSTYSSPYSMNWRFKQLIFRTDKGNKIINGPWMGLFSYQGTNPRSYLENIYYVENSHHPYDNSGNSVDKNLFDFNTLYGIDIVMSDLYGTNEGYLFDVEFIIMRGRNPYTDGERGGAIELDHFRNSDRTYSIDMTSVDKQDYYKIHCTIYPFIHI